MARYPLPSQHTSKQNRRPGAHVPNLMSISMLSSKDVKICQEMETEAKFKN